MPPPTIRAARVADVPTILAFIHALAGFERLAPEVTATPARLAATLFPPAGPPAAECFLLEADGEAAGFALVYATYSTFLAQPGLHLEDLFVSPQFRGRGFGRALLQFLAGETVRRGGGRLEWNVLDWNERAIGFYESFGARRLREWQLCRLDGERLARHRAP